MKEKQIEEKTAHIDLDDFRGPRQDKVMKILKKHEDKGNIKFAGETDKGAIFDIKKPAMLNGINRELKAVGGGYSLVGESLEEKNVPTNPKLWAKYKTQAMSKFDVYPSAYANGWAAKQYKAAGGGWKTVKEDRKRNDDTPGNDDPCWTTHKKVGMKKKNGKMVPNCVPKNEGVDEAMYKSGRQGFR